MEKLLSSLLSHKDNRLRLFDMGRRVSKLSTDVFAKVEQNLVPYPMPFLHHAWIGMLMWNPKKKDENLIWFLKFPLDEQGFLVQAARDDIVNRLLQNALMPDIDKEDALKDNPFSFTPDAEKMAIFHAQAALILGQPASQYYEDVQQYLSAQRPYEYWENLGLQGIADFIVRLDQGTNEQSLCTNFGSLPTPLLLSISRLLEHSQPSYPLLSTLSQYLNQLLEHEECSPDMIAALVRAISNTTLTQARDEMIINVLSSAYATHTEVLLAVATRNLTSLYQPEILHAFLERLAICDAGQQAFTRILSDLMFLPEMRALILKAFRHDGLSDALRHAIGAMLGQKRSASSH
ncbi:DUF3549 family protein [Nitrincola alkalisediminis]|uniref:DUF3549 family protein n=1 Tax=Nitrincola alkalisediminis TaxID=1366656 RepID=UPI0018758A4E|nr:DUF3549 family protein [Nitrincola alkalisediminis]